MEALGFNFKTVADGDSMEAFIHGSNVLEINNDVVRKTIEIRKSKKKFCLTQLLLPLRSLPT